MSIGPRLSDTAFPACITFDEANEALAQARRAAASAGPELDLSGLTHFDSTAVAVLIALRREAAHGPAFKGVPPNLRKLAGLYGVETLLFGPNA